MTDFAQIVDGANNDELSRFEDLILKKMEVGVLMRHSQTMVKNMTVDARVDASMRQVEYAFLTYIMGNDIKHTVSTYPEPATWWDEFKRLYFPGWLKRRFPVRERERKFSEAWTHVCPHLNIETRDDQDVHLRFLSRPDQLRRWE